MLQQPYEQESDGRIHLIMNQEGDAPLEISFPETAFLQLSLDEKAVYVGALKSLIMSLKSAEPDPSLADLETILALDGASFTGSMGDCQYRGTSFGGKFLVQEYDDRL